MAFLKNSTLSTVADLDAGAEDTVDSARGSNSCGYVTPCGLTTRTGCCYFHGMDYYSSAHTPQALMN